MKKTLFLTAALLLATVSGQGAVTLLDGFTPTTQTSSNSQARWSVGTSSFSEGWAVSFQVAIPGNVNNGDTLFSTKSGDPNQREWQFAFKVENSNLTLTMNNNGQNTIFTTQTFTKSDLINTPLTLIVRKTEDNKSLVTFYLGDEEIASGTSNTLMSLTKNSSTFWSNSGRTQLSDIQGVTFDASDSNTDVLAALGIVSVPEPATASLGILGLAALMIRRRRA